AVILVGLVLVVLAVPGSRRFTVRRLWCVLARHRIQRLCWEARLHTRAGRLPLMLRARPTKVGERVHVLCRAGICAEDFEDRVGEPPPPRLPPAPPAPRNPGGAPGGAHRRDPPRPPRRRPPHPLTPDPPA